ncbi:MAG: hypothetical protein WAO29_01445 [Candidatus Nanopelagicales bacterium]
MTRARDVADSALVHIATETFSAVASQSINDVFSADYNFYRLVFRIESKSTTSSTFLRFRASGTDNTSSEYAFGFIGRTPGTTTQIESNGTSAFILSTSNDQSQTTSLDISYPFQTGRTHIEGTIIQRTGNTGLGGGGQMLVDTSYDGFTLLPSTGNITGTLSVYRYRK